MLTSVYTMDDDPIDCLIAQKIITSSFENARQLPFIVLQRL
jgi:hypothetical protein